MAALDAAGVDSSVGPAATSGWACVLLDGDAARVAADLGLVTYLWAGEDRSGLTVGFGQRGAKSRRVAWRQARDTAETDGLADALVGQFGPATALGEVRTLLAREDLDVAGFWAGLESLLKLPELDVPTPERCVVATRGDAAMARLAAGIAGPSWLAPDESGWTIVIPSFTEDAPFEALAAATSSAVRRRDRVVLVWALGDALGLQVWRAGSLEVGTSWGTGWEAVVSDQLAFEAAVVAAVTQLNPGLHEPSLRALLRRTQLDDRALAALLDVLGLPGGVAGILRMSDAPEHIPGAELVSRMSPRHVTRAALRSDRPDRAVVRMRPLYLAYAVVTALAALVCLAMTGLQVAVLVTDGSVVDQPGASSQDRWFVGVFAVLTLVLVPTAIYRLRRARQRGEPKPLDPA